MKNAVLREVTANRGGQLLQSKITLMLTKEAGALFKEVPSQVYKSTPSGQCIWVLKQKQEQSGDPEKGCVCVCVRV